MSVSGAVTSIIVNPLWVIQASQATRTMPQAGSKEPAAKKLGFVQTIQHILRKDGVGAFWRGLGPALVLVVNPVLQYTVFEQLKNLLVKRRTIKLRARDASAAIAILSDWDYFLLGALSKLGIGWIYPPASC